MRRFSLNLDSMLIKVVTGNFKLTFQLYRDAKDSVTRLGKNTINQVTIINDDGSAHFN